MPKREQGGDGGKPKPKGKKLHLHQVISEHVVDKDGKSQGVVHHHVYKDHHSDPHAHPPRPMGMSSTPEEAGEHVADQMGQAWQGGGEGGEGGGAPDEGGGAAPDAGAAGGGGAAEPEE